MSTIYRSPNVVIDVHEWHLAVTNRGRGRIAKQFYFRPLSAQRLAWRPIHEWRDALPERFGSRFQTYRTHALLAIEGETKRAALVEQLQLRNAA